MKKLFLTLALFLCFASLQAQNYFYAVDTLETGDSIKTYTLSGKYSYVTVTARSISPSGVVDTLHAFNVFSDTSKIAMRKIQNFADDSLGVIPAGKTFNFFLLDPYISTLRLVRTTRVWQAGWRLIITIKAIKP